MLKLLNCKNDVTSTPVIHNHARLKKGTPFIH